MDRKPMRTTRGIWMLWALTALIMIAVLLWAATLMRGE